MVGSMGDEILEKRLRCRMQVHRVDLIRATISASRGCLPNFYRNNADDFHSISNPEAQV